MKAVIFANTDGNLELISNILDDELDVHIGICLGNLPIVSQKTPIDKFWDEKHSIEGRCAKRFLSKSNSLPKVVYSIFGTYDDPFIGNEPTFVNVLSIRPSTIMRLQAHDIKEMQGHKIPILKEVSLGFLSGYYSKEKFDKTNVARTVGLREKASLALCEEDFSMFANQNVDFLFTFESPHKIEDIGKTMKCGSDLINDLIYKTRPKLHFHAHSREAINGYINESLSIGVPPLSVGYFVLNFYTGEANYKLAPRPNKDNNTGIILKNRNT